MWTTIQKSTDQGYERVAVVPRPNSHRATREWLYLYVCWALASGSVTEPRVGALDRIVLFLSVSSAVASRPKTSAPGLPRMLASRAFSIHRPDRPVPTPLTARVMCRPTYMLTYIFLNYVFFCFFHLKYLKMLKFEKLHISKIVITGISEHFTNKIPKKSNKHTPPRKHFTGFSYTTTRLAARTTRWTTRAS
jgi:hypothetical protein